MHEKIRASEYPSYVDSQAQKEKATPASDMQKELAAKRTEQKSLTGRFQCSVNTEKS